MPRTAIVETATGAILVLDPPTDDDGNAILPEGVACHVTTLSAAQEAQFQAAADAATTEVLQAATADAALKGQRVADLATVLDVMPTPEAKEALGRLLGAVVK